MKLGHSVAVFVIVLLAGGCGGRSPQPTAARKPFLDEKFKVPAGLEWNKEVTAKSGGTISFRITSQGPFAVTVVTAKGHKALTDKKALDETEILLVVDSKEPNLDGKVTIPAGSSYFIIQNQTDKDAEIQLQCFPPG